MTGLLISVVEILVRVFACVLLVDFLSGFFHWLEDAYGREHWPITGRLVTQPNILHHHDGRYFTHHSWFYSARLLLAIGVAVLVGAWLLGFLNWMTWLVVALGVNANEFHKWAHRSPEENGRLITALQRSRLLQSQRHHAQHHRDDKDSHYCVVTEFLNPLLDRLEVWDRLERLIFAVTGARRRHDSSVSRVPGSDLGAR